MVQGRLLDIAVREFGSKGLEGVSTRGLAAAAGTAMSSITYHYQGKEGLYLAAADHIAGHMAAAMGAALSETAVPADPAAARAAVHVLLNQFLDRLVADDDSCASLFIVREQMNPTEAFERLYAGPMGRLAERLVALIRAVTGGDDGPARLAAMSLVGQVLVWRSSRAMAERLLGHPIDADSLPAISSQLRANTDCILDRLTDRQEPR